MHICVRIHTQSHTPLLLNKTKTSACMGPKYKDFCHISSKTPCRMYHAELLLFVPIEFKLNNI